MQLSRNGLSPHALSRYLGVGSGNAYIVYRVNTRPRSGIGTRYIPPLLLSGFFVSRKGALVYLEEYRTILSRVIMQMSIRAPAVSTQRRIMANASTT